MRKNAKALLELNPARRQPNRPYKYRPGKFTLTANFKDETILQSTVDIVGSLIPLMTQKQLSVALGKSLSVIQKLVRIHAAQKSMNQWVRDEK